MVLTREILLGLMSALIVLAQQGRVPAIAESQAAGRGYVVSGLAIGMDLTAFQLAYPATPVTLHQAVRYCYGRLSSLEQLSWASADAADGEASVRVIFHQLDGRYRLTNLVRTETIDIQAPDLKILRDFRDRLTRQHGPYTRLLARRKMEPAGRIIGFEWSYPGEQSLSVVVHEDYVENSGQIIATTRLTNALPGMRTARAMTARNRAVIKSFRRQCQLANK